MAIYGGLQPFGNVKGKHIYKIASDESSDIFKGDPIKVLNTGYVTVCEAAPTAPFLGAALAFFDSQMNPINYYAAASYEVVCYVLVADDPEQEYVMAEDSASDPLELADLYSTITFTTGTGNSSTGLSAFTLDSSEHAATATDPVKVMRLAPITGNTEYSATTCPNPKWCVKPNFHVSRDTTGI